MAKEIIKRGGKHEPFRAEKIKSAVRKACQDARVAQARIKRIVSQATGPVLRFAAKRKAIRTSVIRTKVLASLKKAEPAAWKVWIRYDKRRLARRRARKQAGKKRR